MPLNKQQLTVLNSVNFPNNNSQYISPSLLREFNNEMIAALQLTQSMSEYAVLVGNNTFVGNNVMAGNLTVTGTISASVIHTIYETASVIYSSGSNQLGDELTDVQTLSGSVLIQGGLFVNGVPVVSGQTTGSSLITASVNLNTITFTKGDSSQFSLVVDTGSATNQDLGPLNAFTASQQTINSNVSASIALLNSKTGSYATTGSNTFTGNQIISKENVLYTNGIYWNDSTPGYNNIEIVNSATGNLDLSALNGKVRIVNTSLLLTGSALTSSNDISTSANIYAANLTGSVIDSGSLVTTASFNAYTQSTNNRLNNLESTSASVNISITNLNNFTASIDTNFVSEAEFGAFTSSVNSFTQSADNRLDNLEAATSSYAISASVAAVDAAQQAQINSLIAATGSYANSASFAASQLAQDVRIDGLSAQTSSYAISASVAAVDAAQQAQINSLINATSSYADSASFAASQLAQDIRIDGLSAQTASYAISASVAAVDAAQQSQINSLIAATSSYVTESETASFARYDVSNPWSADQTFTNISAVSASFTYVKTIFETASVIYSSGSNQFGDELTDTQTLSGSVKVQGSLTVNGIPVQTSSVDISALNQATASLQAFTQSANIRLDNLESNSASVNTSIANINAFTQSADQRLDSIEAQSGSWVTSAITASSIITASVNVDDITFTKGDGSQFTITVATGSAVSASYAETASLAINAKDIIVNVKNTTGAQINKGTVVRIIGATGDNALIGTASWTDDDNSANTLGFVTANIPNDSFGTVMTQGTLLGINTDGYTAGQLIYLSSSGQYTNVKPPAPYHEVRLGQVLRVQQNNGSVYVLIQNGYELTELHDVDINTGSLANNDLLAYNSSTLQWENKTLTQVGGVLTSSFNAYTQSTDNRLTNIESTTASLNTSITNINAFTQSANGRLNSLEAATSSYVTESESGSFLITGSVAGNVLTFTKGDNTTFNLTVATGSGGGGSIDTGSFATTGSNTFFGSETFNIGLSDEFRVNWGNASSASLYTENSGGPNQTLNLTSASLYINRGGLFFSSGSFTVQAGDMQFNSYPSASFTIRTQYGGDAILRSNSDFTNPNLPFAYFRATPIGGAEIIAFGNSVAISGSGTTIQGVDFIPFSASLDTRINSITGSGGSTNTGSLLVTASFDVSTRNITFTKGDASTFNLGGFAITGSNTFTNTQTFDAPSRYGASVIDIVSSSINFQGVGARINFPNGGYFLGNPGDLMQFTTDGVGQQFSVGDSSVTPSSRNLTFLNTTPNGQMIFTTTGSFTNLRLDTNQSTLGRLVRISDWGNQVNFQLLNWSGSLVLGTSGTNMTTASLSHISSSSGNSFVNLVFKDNNNTATTIISGSNNLFVNPAAPTAGFRRFVGTAGNIELNSSNVPQISASMAYPITMNNNILNGNASTIFMRGPVSSSAWTISANYFGGGALIGQTAALHAQSLVAGLNMVQNVIPGNLTIIAAQTGVNFNQPATLSSNQIGGAATLNMSGSAMQFNNNIVNDATTTITNAYYSSSIGLGQLAVNRNNFAGQNQTMFVSGAAPAGATTFTTPSYSDNAMFGGANTIFCNVSAAPITGGVALHSAIRNIVGGHQLIITGSSNTTLADTYGSAFFGRWNANDGVRNLTNTTIFAVGTGKNNTDRKTGFLIDSGSNTFIEGTLNVSGSTTITGSLTLSSSAAIELDVVGNSQFTGSLTVSGSATVTGSVNISNVIQLAQLDPLPGGADGQLAVSASNLWFYSGSAWNKIAFG